LLSYDTTLRCNFVDLYYTLFGRQKILHADVAALYKPIKVEVEVKFYFINKQNNCASNKLIFVFIRQNLVLFQILLLNQIIILIVNVVSKDL